MISKSGHSSDALRSCEAEFETDGLDRTAFAVRLDFSQYKAEVPLHKHRQGQLVMALHGAVTCKTEDALWLVPPDCGVWIPGGILHSNQATSNARLAYLFVEPGAAALPMQCCTLSVSPMLREMILRLADEPLNVAGNDPIERLVRVMLDELAQMPIEALSLPASPHPKIKMITGALLDDPSDRRTLTDWAAHVAMSERSLKRLMVEETGLPFGRWRCQLHLIIALRELASGASVQSISSDLGYESPTAFIVMFKKALGATPARYFSSRSAVGLRRSP